MRKNNWNAQIVTIENKGHAAYRAGQSESDNPYSKGYHNQNGKGGQLQRQRYDAWLRGFRIAKAATLD